ncbi:MULTISPECIES: flagellar biosynthesis anti-sigma factor FlgM [Acidobacteriaceae]|uniref:flagellar biosynthesis anti-sigma factor FlgM n=1 Tax=Acidobacteriaceae TaxID=204434 RepID=UPI00131D6902|nr:MULTISPECIES: flagellar biosynthesis anti-sigma factor FlgM [Acidobacteriaceae]MDW5266499.1 flagellar biosynthesis anti-sigma factor FlgM [Edaphobacter sp.]
MSYTNGIGSLPQALSSITPAPTQPASQVTESTSASQQRNATATPAKQADQTSLSSAGGVIAHALEGSDVRTDKVAALQKAIASGSYNVSSSDVASKMIDSLLE